MEKEMKNLETLKILWEQFGNIPINNHDKILKPFTVFDKIFPKYTSKFTIWHCFDENARITYMMI